MDFCRIYLRGYLNLNKRQINVAESLDTILLSNSTDLIVDNYINIIKFNYPIYLDNKFLSWVVQAGNVSKLNYKLKVYKGTCLHKNKIHISSVLDSTAAELLTGSKILDSSSNSSVTIRGTCTKITDSYLNVKIRDTGYSYKVYFNTNNFLNIKELHSGDSILVMGIFYKHSIFLKSLTIVEGINAC